jgi:hypothetical protein
VFGVRHHPLGDDEQPAVVATASQKPSHLSRLGSANRATAGQVGFSKQTVCFFSADKVKYVHLLFILTVFVLQNSR